EPKVETAPTGQKPDGRKTEARESDLRLERTVRPADESRSHFAEERVQDEVVEKAEPDREHQEIEEQRLDDNRRRARLGCAQERNEGSDEANEEKSKGEVAKYEPDRISHRCAERRLDPLERQRNPL